MMPGMLFQTVLVGLDHLLDHLAAHGTGLLAGQAANEVGVNLKQGYNGDLTSKQAGSVGGQMVKKMIESYENGMK